MKNILIFRSANYRVMDMLLQKLPKDNCIYCIMQKSAADFFRKKYPYINPLILEGEYIGYHDFISNIKRPDIKFDIIYLPSSSKSFGSFGEILRIIGELKYKELVYFDGDGMETRKVITRTGKLKDNIMSNIFLAFFQIECLLYGLKKRIVDKYFIGE